LQNIIRIVMHHNQSADMPVKFFLVFFYDGCIGLFFRNGVTELDEQFGIIQGG
jgi:hypothetical protein